MGPDAYDFALPAEQIAQQPARERGGARMLVVGPDGTQHTQVARLEEHLPADALVVVNSSSVVPARLEAVRADGRAFELLLCAPGPGQGPGCEVTAWVRRAKKLSLGDELQVDTLRLRFDGPDAVDPRARRFTVVAGDVLEAAMKVGSIPLPPYIERPTGPDAADEERYQTVFDGPRGSVAAPTAGLHFDARLMAAVNPVHITLHVGPGTFLPMDVDDVRDHRVGSERFSIDAEAAARISGAQRDGRPIVAVGTTVTRTLESVWREHGAIVAGQGTTDLVIGPDHRFGVVTHLMTNFHLPRSSLLMLVCSLGGRERILKAYAEAVARGYRFYSYGDCMLVTGVQP